MERVWIMGLSALGLHLYFRKPLKPPSWYVSLLKPKELAFPASFKSIFSNFTDKLSNKFLLISFSNSVF